MARRLFHAIVLVGSSMGASCSSRDAPPSTDARTDAVSDADEETVTTDSFQMIMPMPVDTGAPVDTGKATDSFPMIAIDTSMPPDTFPGIMPPPADTG
jgi:hypothetical protein